MKTEYKQLRVMVKGLIHIARNVTASRGKSEKLRYALDNACDEISDFLKKTEGEKS